MTSLLVVVLGGLATWGVLAVRNRLGHEHWRQYCPATAYPHRPTTCVCRCKPCRSGKHPAT